MAATKKTKTVAKKTTEKVLTSKPEIKLAAAAPAAAFTKGFQQFTQFQPFKLETDMFKGNKQFEDLTKGATAAGQDQVDALVKSSTIFTKGMEDIIKTCMDIVQESGAKNQALAKTAMSCKTLNEFTDFQTKLAQSSYDEFLTNVTKISEKTVKLYTDAMEPINNQMGKSIKRASDKMAA